MKELKLPSMKLLKELVQFAEKDDKNLENFELYLQSVDFSGFDEEVLEKMMKKSTDKWLKKNSVWKKKMKTVGNDNEKDSDISSDSDKSSDSDSDKSSDSDSDKTSDSEKSEEEEEEVDYKWDKKLSNKIYEIKKKKMKKASGQNTNWEASAVISKSNKFTFKLVTNCKYFIYGFVDMSKHNMNGSNYNSNGHFIQPSHAGSFGEGKKGKNSIFER
jgi:hypothetical protein